MILPAVALLLLRTKFPVPLTPPVTNSRRAPLASVSVVPPLFTVRKRLSIVSAELELFSRMAVTLAPMPLIMVVPVPAPTLVTVPELFINPSKVMLPDAAFSLIVKLLVPVTLPTNWAEPPVAKLPMVSVPTLALLVSTIGFTKFGPLVPTSSEAEAEPVSLPSVTVPPPVPPKRRRGL